MPHFAPQSLSAKLYCMHGACTFTEEIGTAICVQLAEGRSLRDICKEFDLATGTVCGWTAQFPRFAEQYSRAREMQADVFAADTIAIADETRTGRKTEKVEKGRHCSACEAVVTWQQGKWAHKDKTPLCEGARAAKTIETKTIEGDMVDRARLQVNARQWYASKLAPKKYGDQQVDSSGSVTIVQVISIPTQMPTDRPELPAIDIAPADQ